MKTKLLLITSILLTFSKICVTQNIIANGSFENFSGTCPSNQPNGAINQVISWKPANVIPALGFSPSVDLYCGGPNYSGCNPGPISNVGSDGIAYLGLHTRIYTPAYNESIYQILSSSLIAGNSYFISFDLMNCQSGLFTQGPSDFCIYMNIDTIIPACPTDNPNVVTIGCIPFDSISNINWKHHSFNFIAPINSKIIAFSGAECNVTEVYYYLDNVNLIANLLHSDTCDPSLEIPNVFTPNNDKINDFFIPTQYNGINDATLKIYNRWGEEVFHTNNILEGWNGFYKNSICSDGTYFWFVEYKTCMNELNKVHGFLTLLK